MFYSELYDLLIILLELYICDRGTIYLKSFIDSNKVGGGKESYFFSKTLPENLGYHLTHTSFSITSCHMKHSKCILRVSECSQKLQNIISTFLHTARSEGHDIVYGGEVVWH